MQSITQIQVLPGKKLPPLPHEEKKITSPPSISPPLTFPSEEREETAFPPEPLPYLLPPEREEIQQEIIALSQELLRMKKTLKPHRVVREERGESLLSSLGGVPTPAPLPSKKEEKSLLGEEEKKLEEKKTLLPPASSLPSPEITPPLSTPSPKFTFWDELLNIRYWVYRESSEKDGYIMLEITLRPEVPVKVIPKDIVFVVDASKSIKEEKLKIFKEGVKNCLQLLNPQDRFNVVVFRERTFFLSKEMLTVNSQNIYKALKFISPFSAEGETDIYRALLPWLSKKTTRPLILFFLSDGKPTVGLTSTKEIVSRLVRESGYLSLFSFTAGGDINWWLLDLLSYQAKGRFYHTPHLYKAEEELKKFFSSFNSPVLVNIHCSYSGLLPGLTYPDKIPHLYRGGRLKIVGRFPPSTKLVGIRLTGEVEGEKKEVIFQAPIPPTNTAGKEVARLWATHRIYHLIERMTMEGLKQKWEREIKKLIEKSSLSLPYWEEVCKEK